MPVHLRKEIDRLNKLLLGVSTLVDEAVTASVTALEERNLELAKSVIANDVKIDLREIDVEEECLKILALYQPVAVDLRFIVAVLKINNDLERIGDLAVNIAERAILLAPKEGIPLLIDFPGMVEKTLAMLKTSLNALINIDPHLAHQVLALDDDVDSLNRHNYDEIMTQVEKDPTHAKTLIHYLSISRFLERVADHATNIAEDVIYLATGEIARHRPERLAQNRLNQKI